MTYAPQFRRSVVLVAVMVAALTRALPAQTSGSLAIVGGRSTDVRGVRSSAITVVPGLTIASGWSTLWLGATGTRFANDAWAVGANVALAARRPLGAGFGAALSTSGSATATSYDVSLVSADVSPTLDWSWRSFTLFGGGKGAVAVTNIARTPGGGLFPPINDVESETRSLVSPTYGARVRIIASDPRMGALLWVREDPMRIESERVTDRIAGATVALHRLTLSGSIGVRDAPGERSEFSSVAASFALTSHVSLDAAGGSYPSDQLTYAAAGRFASVGLTLRAGGSRRRPLPVPSGVQPVARGMTRLSIRAGDASRVELLGDWNGWQPVAAKRASNGVWYVDMQLAPGEYRYAFRVNGTEWRVPEGTAQVDDGFGGKSAYVSVRDTSPRQ
jgi:hypothetical protein